ncbi:MAG: alpha/beta hydrolase fold domain-containing protein, partial [Alphaproteobacteria bacterium]|nr:alpha/beta hydrolase fold domain-containing protein [Alphaproteobacteria bacterium]
MRSLATVYRIALRRRLALLIKGEFDPHPAPPADAELSPSLAHARALDAVPLRLSWSRAGIADPRAWQLQAREKLRALTGYPASRAAPVARNRTDHPLPGGLKRRRVYLRLWNGADAPVDAVWRKGDGRRPVMICLQGTNSGSHLSWGEARMPPDPVKIAGGGDYARQAVARGYVAICLEQSCFGERAERHIVPRSASATIDAANHAFLLGRSLLGERAADVSSLVDWLAADGAGRGLDLAVDPARIFVMGNSAGGSVALHAASLDVRIAGVLASGCVGFVRDTIARRRDDSAQNVVPGLLNWLETDDVVALVAPRPLLVISGIRDHIFPYAGAASVVESARRVYQAMGAGGNLTAVPADGPHRFYPKVAWPAFERLVGGTSS